MGCVIAKYYRNCCWLFYAGYRWRLLGSADAVIVEAAEKH
jgi:hypothetical protein